MKNNFRKNGKMRVRYGTPEERREILRILEEQRGFHIDEEQKRLTKIHPMSTRTFDINLKSKTIQYEIRPFIGAAMMSSGVRFYSAQEFFRIAELGFKTVPRYPVFHVPHAGNRFPFDLLPSVCVSEEQFRKYHDLMSDTEAGLLVPEVYRGGDMCARFPVSRLMCDVAVNPGLMNVRGAWEIHGLTGEGQVISTSDSGIDTGDVATLHPDFFGRIALLTNSVPAASLARG